MLSLETIRSRNRIAAMEAAKDNKIPFVIWPEDLQNIPPFPFPFIGDYRPPGWELVNEYFVDSTGLGRPGEPALTVAQFKEKLQVGLGYAVIEAGEFQVYVGEFRKI